MWCLFVYGMGLLADYFILIGMRISRRKRYSCGALAFFESYVFIWVFRTGGAIRSRLAKARVY